MEGRRESGPRCIALVGPFASGKTTLLEAILAHAGAIGRVGTVDAGTTVGDASEEARAHRMSVEANVATLDFMGDAYTFIDCPGSIEFLQDMRGVLPAVDAAIVVCEADERKLPMLQLIMRDLEQLGVPRFVFLNKVDKAESNIRDALELLQPASSKPLVMRQIPIWNDGVATGFIDLALERAFVYREHAPSNVVELPSAEREREKQARYQMLERLADYDDVLMEQLLEDIEPPRDRVFDDLARELRDGRLVPMLLGSALRGNGVLRLMKALRHEAPGLSATVERLGVEPEGEALAQVLKTMHTAHAGKTSLVRVLRKEFADGAQVTGSAGGSERIVGISRPTGGSSQKLDRAAAGDAIFFGRLDSIRTGETIAAGKKAPEALAEIAAPEPVLAFALRATERKDEVKVAASIQRLIDEDPALFFVQSPETGEMILKGQGEMHLRVAVERLAGKFGVRLDSQRPRVGYRETIKKSVTVRGRHKKQTGGHGQFGDIVVDIKPMPRGTGFVFDETITGGVVPRQYIPSVEKGVRDFLKEGPLGFPVVDVGVTLTDGSYHAVDSSDMAFQQAGRIAMNEGMPQCAPVLLEPIFAVEIAVPAEATARVNAIVSGRRGQLLGFDSRPGWNGWDLVRTLMPESEIGDLIVEIRSATQGVGSFTQKFDHLAEVTGKLADQVVASRQAAE
jgi:elongation factor G